MELEDILSSWLLPAAGTVTAVGVAALAGRKIYRRYVMIEVNCHFCDTNSVTFRHFRECWFCPNCTQYNGFSASGDYNREVPGQRCPESDLPSESRPTVTQNSTQSALCPQCNFHQTLKIEALRNFGPYDEHNFDAELQEYKAALERTYRLCRRCENRVHQVLGAQDSSLRRNLVQLWKQRSFNATMTSTPKKNGTVFPPKAKPPPRSRVQSYAKLLISSMLVLLTMFPSYKPATKEFLAKNDLVLAGIDFVPFSTSCVDWLELFYTGLCIGALWTSESSHFAVKGLQLLLCAANAVFPSAILALVLLLTTFAELLPYDRLKKALKKTKVTRKTEKVEAFERNGSEDRFLEDLRAKWPKSGENGRRETIEVMSQPFLPRNNNDLDEVEDMDISFDAKVETTANGLDELHIGDSYRSVHDGTSRTQIVLDSDRDFPSPITRPPSVILRPSRFGMTPFGGARSINYGHLSHSASFSQPSTPVPSLFGDGDRFDTGSIFSEPCRPTEFRPPSPPNYNSTFIEERSSFFRNSSSQSDSPSLTRRSVASDVVSTGCQTELSGVSSSTVVYRHPESAFSKLLLFGALLCFFFAVILVFIMLRHEEIAWAYRALTGLFKQ